jgi:signal peptidase I (EC:3.4.21.89). Serine peptidase. MEROPS family S26A
MAGKKRSVVREYVEAILWAVVLVLLLRAFLIQAFRIPSESMVPTLLVGDMLFVNRFEYGPKIPLHPYAPAGPARAAHRRHHRLPVPREPAPRFHQALHRHRGADDRGAGQGRVRGRAAVGGRGPLRRARRPAGDALPAERAAVPR